VATEEGSMSHLLEDQIAGYLGHTLAGESLVQVELHLARCAACRAEVIEATEILRPSRRVRWPILAPVAAAAAAIVLFVTWPQPGGTPLAPSQFREVPAAPATVPTVIAPIGPARQIREFVWTRAIDADQYRLTLYDGEGSVIWRETTTDSLLQAPDSVPLRPGRQYLWKVEARTGWDVWESSELTPFQLQADSASAAGRQDAE
jgi:hypothetical protein